MANGPMIETVRWLRRAALLPQNSEATGGQLLESFLHRGDEAAFEALVRRHGPMVLAVCRRVLGDEHDAEDRTALKARTARARRRKHERQAHALPHAASGNGPEPDLRTFLDQHLERLPAAYRAAVVLCDLEGRTKQEAARQLGIPEGTLSSRLARGRTLLRARLARWGTTLSLGSLATALTTQAAATGVPAPLAASTVRAATHIAAGHAATGVVTTNVATLTEGMVKAMGMSKLKAAAVILLAVSVVGLGIGVGAYHATAAAQDAAQQQPGAKKRAAPAPRRDEGPAAKEMLLPPAHTLTLALVSLDSQGRLVVRERITRPDGTDGMTTVRYDAARAQVYEAGGKAVPPKVLPRLLKEEVLAFVAFGRQVVVPTYLRLLREGTLVFVLPEAEPEPVASSPPPQLVPQPPRPASTPKQQPDPAGEARKPGADLEALLLARLRRDRRLEGPGAGFTLTVQEVQGRRLMAPIFKRWDSRGREVLTAEGQEAALRVDLSRNVLWLRLVWGSITTDNGRAFFEERSFEVPLPRDLRRDAGKESGEYRNEPRTETQPAEADVLLVAQRTFEVPFQIDANSRPRVREIALYVSTDRGRTWREEARNTPDRQAFTFHAPVDGLYWFTVVVIDREGRRDPADVGQGAPGLKVRVQTTSKEPVDEGRDQPGEAKQQQAEKDFNAAEFYRRAGHAGSAAFYYELVRRRYPGTPFAEKAAERLRELPSERPWRGGGQEKPVARVAQIIIVGNRKTPDHVIRENVQLFPGQVLSYPALRAAEQNLERLNLFRARPRVAAIDDPETSGDYKDILIQVEEK